MLYSAGNEEKTKIIALYIVHVFFATVIVYMKREQNPQNGREQLLMLTDLAEAKKYILNELTKVSLHDASLEEYLTFSEQSTLLRASNSEHYIHLTDFEVIMQALHRRCS